MKTKTITSLLVLFALIFTFSVPAFAKDTTPELYSQASLIQYYPECPPQENNLQWVDFTGSHLNITAAATKGAVGNANSVVIRIKQQGFLGIMTTICEKTIPVDGNGYIINSNLTIDKNKSVLITIAPPAGCTANIALTIVSHD